MTFISANRFSISARTALVMAGVAASLVACQHDSAGPSELPDDTAQLGGAIASLEQLPATSDGLVTFVVHVRAHDVALSSYQGTVHFAPGSLELIGKETPVSQDGAYLVNASGFADGHINFAAFTPSTFDASGSGTEAFRFTVRASDADALTRVVASLDVVGTDNGAAMRTQAQSHLMLPRPSLTCNVTPGVWGDANGDNAVNVADAQQIARYNAGLAVANTETLNDRGDVNADGSVDIIDAQQIARFSVGLSAVERVNADMPLVAASVFVPTGVPVPAGSTTQLTAFVRDTHSADMTGCVAVTWSSSDNSRATVDANGAVTALAAGTAIISASATGQTGYAVVTVTQGGVRAVVRAGR